MSTRSRAVALAVLVVVSGVALTAGVSATESVRSGGAQDDAPPDPDSDVLGWECGYWHNESIAIDQTDGLDEDELDAVVCRTMARVEQVRGLEFQEEVPVSIQSRDEFTREVRNRSLGPDLRAFDNAKFEALFLINQSTDSIEVQDRNSGASILGYYSPASDEIVLVAPNESSVEIDEYTLAHELVHALQDQHFDLSTERGETRDEINARDGLVEGEARYVEYQYRNDRCHDPNHAWNGTCVTPSGTDGGGGDLANMGVYFLKYQPYSDGPSFVAHLRSTGGWDAIGAAYDDPPASAEQVIHPEKYEDDHPVNVTLEDRTSDEWERVRPPGRPDYAEVGQTGIASMLVYPLYHSGGRTQIVPPTTFLNYTGPGEISTFDPLNYGFDAAEGWGGDRMHVYRDAENETAYVWRITWDSPDEADEFLGSYRQVLEYWGGEEVEPDTYRFSDTDFGDAIRVLHEGDTVTVVSAPSMDDLDGVRNGSAPRETATPTPTSTPTEDPTDPEPSPTSTVEGNGTATPLPNVPVPDQPGFGIGAALAGVLVTVAAIARRRTGDAD